jgi:uncharacterized protein (UPF0335 family)
MGKLPFKEDEDFRKHNQKAHVSAAEELRKFIEEVESDDAQIADIQRDKKDRFTMIKSKGYNVKALRRLLAERKKDMGEEQEMRDVMEQYKSLLL